MNHYVVHLKLIYQVEQKVLLSYTVTSYGKTQTNFSPNPMILWINYTSVKIKQSETNCCARKSGNFNGAF